MFSIGQEVVCIDDSPDGGGTAFPVKKDSIVPVLGLINCCGRVAIDVGITIPWASKRSFCGKCNKTASKTIWYLNSDRFAPLISNDDLQEALTECLETELEFI